MPDVSAQTDLTVKPTEQVPNALAPMNLFAAEQGSKQRFIGAMQGLVDVVGGQVKRLVAQEANTEFAKYQGFVNQKRREMEEHVRTNNTYEDTIPEEGGVPEPGYRTVWAGKEKEIEEYQKTLNGRTAQQAATNWWVKTAPIYSGEVDGWVNDGRTDYIHRQSMENIENIITGDYELQTRVATAASAEMLDRGITETEDGKLTGLQVTEEEAKMEAIKNIVAANVASQVWTEEDGAKIIADAEKGIKEFEYAELVTQVWTTSKGAGSLAAQIEFIDNIPGLENADRTNLIGRAKRHWENLSAVTKETTEATQANDRKNVIEEINSTDVADVEGFLENSSLDPSEQEVWIKKWSDRNEAIAAGKVDPWTVDDSVVVRELRNRIRAGEKLDEGELEAKLGIGLSKTTYDALREWNSDSDMAKVLNRPVVKRGQAIVDRTRALALKLDEEDPIARAITEDKALANAVHLDQFALAIGDDPQFTQKYQDEVKRINQPPIDEVTLKWYDNLLRRSARFLGGAAGKFVPLEEEKALAKKKIDKMKELGLWENLSKQDKEEVQGILELGGTIEEVRERF